MPKERPVKMCWKGTGKNRGGESVCVKKYIFRLKIGEVGYS